MLRQETKLHQTQTEVNARQAAIANLDSEINSLKEKLETQEKIEKRKKRALNLSNWLYEIAFRLPHGARLLSLSYNESEILMQGQIPNYELLEKYKRKLSNLVGIHASNIDGMTLQNNKLLFNLTLSIKPK